MASRAISGKPGGGKSYLATRWILRDLLETENPIVTNIPLDFDGIAAYCEKHGKPGFDVGSRITVLPDESVREFWRYRGNGVILPGLTDSEIASGVRPDPQSFGGPVCYYLDEIHKFLNSREWKNTGPLLLWYISQHRHFGDEVVWITQHVGNVDKQWKSVTQDYTYVQNFAKEKFRGFTKGNKFRVETYLEPYTGSQTLQESEEVKPDWEGVGSCYKTSIAGGDADKGKRVKGLPVWVLFAGIGVAAVLLALFFMYGPDFIGRKMAGEVTKKESSKGPEMWQRTAAVGNATSTRGGAPLVTPDLAPKKEPPSVLAVPLKSVSAHEVLSALNDRGQQMQGVSVYPSPFGSGVVIYGPDLQTVIAVSETIKAIDSEAVNSVVVQAVVLRRSKGKSSSVGMWEALQGVVADGGFGLSQVAFDPVAGILTFGAITGAQETVRLLGSQNVKRYGFEVESRPVLSMSSGRTAWFTSGREVPIPVSQQNIAGTQTSISYKKVNFSLGVTATVMPSGRLVLDVVQSNDDVIGSAEIGGDPVPTIATQSMQTRLELVAGQVAVLGGVEVANRGDDSRHFPVLGAVPPLSWLFGARDKTEEKSELVVALTAFVLPAGVNAREVRRAEPVNVAKREKGKTIPKHSMPLMQRGKLGKQPQPLSSKAKTGL